MDQGSRIFMTNQAGKKEKRVAVFIEPVARHQDRVVSQPSIQAWNKWTTLLHFEASVSTLNFRCEASTISTQRTDIVAIVLREGWEVNSLFKGNLESERIQLPNIPPIFGEASTVSHFCFLVVPPTPNIISQFETKKPRTEDSSQQIAVKIRKKCRV